MTEKIEISRGHGRGQSWTNYDDDNHRMQVTKDGNQYYISIFKLGSSKRLLHLRGMSKQDAAKIVKLAKKVGIVKLAKTSQVKKFVGESFAGAILDKSERKKIPKVAYHSFNKKYEKMSKAEGFHRIYEYMTDIKLKYCFN